MLAPLSGLPVARRATATSPFRRSTPSQYGTAGSPDEAMSLVGKNGRYLGGGIDLLDEMKEYIVSPDVLVNVKTIKDLGTIELLWGTNFKCRLGANVTVAEIAAHEELKNALPGLAEATSEV